MNKIKFKFIDLFAGIGGFHLAFNNVGAKCVFSCEWDEAARKTYKHNFEKISPNVFKAGNFVGDINSIGNIRSEIPDFDILTAGFPCQPFSQAGFKKGFEDTRGTLFFNIAEIIKTKKPKAFFLENVRGLLNHDNGKTFAKIKSVLEDDLGYSFNHFLVKASEYGRPQLRPRLFMIGFKDRNIVFKRPEPVPLEMTMSDIWEGKCTREIGFTLRVGGARSGIHDRRNWDGYIVDGELRRISPKEGKLMQGFPDHFEFPVSQAEAMKQLGNSVAVPAIQAFAQNIVEALRRAHVVIPSEKRRHSDIQPRAQAAGGYQENKRPLFAPQPF